MGSSHTPSRPASPDSQAAREAATGPDLAMLAEPLAAYLPVAIRDAEGQPQVSNEHRALLREVPAYDLAVASVRGVLGVLWRSANAGDGDGDLAGDGSNAIKAQVVGRSVGTRVLRAYARARSPRGSRRQADLEAEELGRTLTLRRVTEMGFYFTHALHVAVPGLLRFHPPQRVFTSKRRPRYSTPLLSLDPEVLVRLGIRRLVAAGGQRPMVEPPLPWRGRSFAADGSGEVRALQRGGYRYDLRESVPLLKRVPVSEADPDCPSVVYEALNALQNTAWRVNPGVLNVAVALKATLNAEERWVVEEAESEASQPALYFVHSLDYRSRVYAHGSALLPGGPDLARALLTFAQGRPVTSEDERAIGALDQYGERCLGAPLDMRMVTEIGEHPLDTRERWWPARDRWQYLAYCLERSALTTALEAGQAYVSALPVWQDASANGLQHMALLLRDPALAARVNVAPSGSGQRGDIYADVAAKMTARLRTLKNPLAQELLLRCGGAIERGHAKSPTMTFGYGATQQTFHDNFAVNELGLRREADGIVPRDSLASLFAAVAWQTLEHDVASNAVALREWFQQVAKLIGKTGQPARWTVPGSGFPAAQRSSFKTRPGRPSLWWEGTRYQVTAPVEESRMLDTRRHQTSLAPNVVHSLDAAHLMLTVTAARAENFDTPVATIHDSFATCATDAPVLEQLFRVGFLRIYRGDPLGDLAAQFRGQCPGIPEPPPRGTLDVSRAFAAQPLK